MLTHAYFSWDSFGSLDGEIEAVVFLYRGSANVNQTLPLTQKFCRFEVLKGGVYHVEVVFATSGHRYSRSASIDFTVPL